MTFSRRSAVALLNGHHDDDGTADARFEPSRLVELARSQGLINAVAPIEKEGGEMATALLQVKSKWMDVTPAKARKWLENNVRNRSISTDTVEAYAREMSNGVWIPTHQGIAFNNRDELIDGQHRLHAIIKSRCTVRLMVTFGLPWQIEGKAMTMMDAVDRGRQRSVADQLKIQHNLSNGSIIAAVSRSLAYICSDARTRRLSVSEVLEIWEAFKAPIGLVIEHRSKSHGLKMSGVLAGFAFAMAAHEETETQDEIAATYKRLTSRDGSLQGPMGGLLQFLTSPDSVLLTRGTDRGLAEIVMQAIYLQLKGRPDERLVHSTEGADVFRKLQPQRVKKVAGLFTLKLPEPEKEVAV